MNDFSPAPENGDSQPLRLELSQSSMSTDEVCEWIRTQTCAVFTPRGGSFDGKFSFSADEIGDIVAWSGVSEVGRVLATQYTRDAFKFYRDYGAGLNISVGSKLHLVHGERAALLKLDQISELEINAGSHAEGFIISSNLINRTLADYYDCAVPSDFQFNPDLDTADESTSCLLRLVHSFKSVCAAAEVSPVVISRFEDVISTLVVTNFSHSLSGMGSSRRGHLVTPLQVKRAMEFARANAGQPITSLDMSHAAGVSLRTLQENFQRFLGTTPIDFLKKIRLEGARRELVNAAPGVKVADIARKWGFSHMGRFSIDYRASFGVTPTEERMRGRK